MNLDVIVNHTSSSARTGSVSMGGRDVMDTTIVPIKVMNSTALVILPSFLAPRTASVFHHRLSATVGRTVQMAVTNKDVRTAPDTSSGVQAPPRVSTFPDGAII
jgi:hypothetical protein